MTLDDLIAKVSYPSFLHSASLYSKQPVQRVCKYRLLLSELLRTCPETNFPLIYTEIKNILDRNIQAVDRINTVVGDPNLRIRIKKTIALHERLDYSDQVSISYLLRS